MTLILYQQLVEFLQILRTGQSADFIGWLPLTADSRAFFILVFALGYFIILAVFIVSSKLTIRNFFDALPDVWYFLFIFLSSLVIRLTIISLIDTQPVYDFGNINSDVLLFSQGRNPQNLYATTHVDVTIIYGFLYRVFGPGLRVTAFLNRKFSILWTNSNGILFWVAPPALAGDPNSIADGMQKINLTDFAIMFFITITCLIGTVLAFFKDLKPVLFFCLLTFFGFNTMKIPFELQTRYRTVVMPLIIFFACWTLAAISVPSKNHDHESKMWSFRQ